MKLNVVLLFPVALFISFLGSASLAGVSEDRASTSKAEYCRAQEDSHHFRRLAHNPENLLTLKNQGGLFNGGVCWWHNLFQRSALYLSVFQPELPKPDRKLAKKIIHSIAAGRRVVEIPGYKNISEFSKDWEKEIQSKLEAWQREDGFLKFAWIQGLSGSHQTDPKKIAATFDYILDEALDSGEIHWTMWQVKGITAHASINIGGDVSQIQKNPLYRITHIDSNYPQIVRVMSWAPPARSVDSYFGKFVPYVARKSDLKDFKKAATQYCGSRAYHHDFFFEPLKNSLD